MKTLSIVADENIPGIYDLFSTLGKVTLLPGREIRNVDLLSADILLVRSVTAVNEQLLRNTPIAFVASSTIGINHLDTEYLDQQNIHWANAPGSNANSVAEYLLSCIASFDNLLERLIDNGKAGIIGYGNVGTCVAKKLSDIGIQCVLHDPLLDQSLDPRLASLDEALDTDLICLHTPLTFSGSHPTQHLIDEHALKKLRSDAVLINAGRGEVVDNSALKAYLKINPSLQVVLDVWENEPSIDTELLNLLSIATPHIAGYSNDGKRNGLTMIYQACCEHLGVEPIYQDAESNKEKVALELLSNDPIDLIREAITSVYSVKSDEKAFKAILENETVAVAFDSCRKHYPNRMEFANYAIKTKKAWSELTLKRLDGLGFELVYE